MLGTGIVIPEDLFSPISDEKFHITVAVDVVTDASHGPGRPVEDVLLSALGNVLRGGRLSIPGLGPDDQIVESVTVNIGDNGHTLLVLEEGHSGPRGGGAHRGRSRVQLYQPTVGDVVNVVSIIEVTDPGVFAFAVSEFDAVGPEIPNGRD